MQVHFIYDSTSHFVHFAYKFTGKERDSESGLDYFGARHYSSNMGRFMSPDYSDGPDTVPYADLRNPQSLNLYAYVNNNPLSETDDDGHDGALPTATCSPAWLCAIVHFLGKLGGPGDGPAPGSGPGDYWPNPYGRQVAQGVGARAQGAAPVVAGGAIFAAGMAAAPVMVVEGAGAGVSTLGLHEFTGAEIETAVESASESTGVGSTAGRDALQSHATRPGPFNGMQKADPSGLIRQIMRNPTKVVQTTSRAGIKYIDISSRSGGVRLLQATGKFVTFLSR
jgi:RHS repeat-associated protein